MRKAATRPAAPATGAFIDDLENALAHGNVAQRVDSLRRITDLFVARAPDYTDEQIAVFDDVFMLLVNELETAALATLAQRLAPIPNAPPRAIHTLAFDDRIDVAGPVLTQSERLSDDSLMENANTKGQGHLLAIARRARLAPRLTEILLRRGNDDVARTTAANPGAEFSDTGYALLIDRCAKDDELALIAAKRDTMPRHQYLRLLAKASTTARAELEKRYPLSGRIVADAVETAASTEQHQSIERSEAYQLALVVVKSLRDADLLDEAHVLEFVQARSFEECTAALSLLANLPVELTESLMVESRAEGILVIAKACGFGWPTVEAIMRMRGALSGLNAQDLELCKASYLRLKPTTAQQVLRFHRMRGENSTIAQAS